MLAERASRADEFFGEDRILATLNGASGGTPAAEVLAAVVADANRLARGVKPGDDVATTGGLSFGRRLDADIASSPVTYAAWIKIRRGGSPRHVLSRQGANGWN